MTEKLKKKYYFMLISLVENRSDYTYPTGKNGFPCFYWRIYQKTEEILGIKKKQKRQPKSFLLDQVFVFALISLSYTVLVENSRGCRGSSCH